MKRYVIVVIFVWAVNVSACLYAYKFIWLASWLGRTDLIGILIFAATAMTACAVGINETLLTFPSLPWWLRSGIGATVLGLLFGGLAFALGTQVSGPYNWPSLSGLATVLAGIHH